MQTLFIGKNLIFLPHVQSTNSYAIDLLKNVKLPEGTVVHTLDQTLGKGQRGAVWASESGQNLTASFVLKPHFLELDQQFFLYQVAALACYDTIAELVNSSQIDIKIKWPNDILLAHKKVAGILIENAIQHNQMYWSVIGIGLNVNQTRFPPELKASSLKLVRDESFEIQSVLTLLCKHLEKHYIALLNSKFDEIQTSYLEKLFGLNEFHKYEYQTEIKVFKLTGIHKNGLLMIEDELGEALVVDVKELKLIY